MMAPSRWWALLLRLLKLCELLTLVKGESGAPGGVDNADTGGGLEVWKGGCTEKDEEEDEEDVVVGRWENVWWCWCWCDEILEGKGGRDAASWYW